MRIIGNFNKETSAKKFSMYLQKEGIENTIDGQFDQKRDSFSYSVWVHNEDDIEKAKMKYEQFAKNPDDNEYDIPVSEDVANSDVMVKQSEKNPIIALKRVKSIKAMRAKKFPYIVTVIFFGICAFFYLLNLFQAKANKDSVQQLTPVQYYLLFDVPRVLVEQTKLLKEYNIDVNKPEAEQPQEFVEKWKALKKQPYWTGFYDVVVSHIKDKSKPIAFSPYLFDKIRHGQIWRLISPAFLHVSFLHFLFNMIWLWVLGKQMEARLSKFRYILFVLIVGVSTDVLQYFISGPYFLGYSGVIMGMVGFIWMRQKIAPWEGYPLPKITIIFLALYVLALLALQVFSFFFEAYAGRAFGPNIANAAHISGAIIGIILGRIPYFSWRPDER